MTAAPPQTLAAVTHHVTQSQVAAYADAANDHNPLHLDEAFASATPYGRRIAHGMLVLAFLSELMASHFGVAWAYGGKLKVRFRAPVYSGDTVTASGALKAVADGVATYEVSVRSQDGAGVITGEASVGILGQDEQD